MPLNNQNSNVPISTIQQTKAEIDQKNKQTNKSRNNA